MPEIIVYTNDGDCANGVAEIQPFTTGDATDEWTLRFNNGTDFYAVSDVTMKVGHVNGLPAGTYNDAFKWTDRADNVSIGNIVISAAGVPTLTFDTSTSPLSNPPLGGVVGTNGVYILRGPELDGSVSGATIEFAGRYLFFGANDSVVVQINNLDGGNPAIAQFNINGSYELQSYQIPNGGTGINIWRKGFVSSVNILEAGSGFTSDQSSQGTGINLSKKFIEIISITSSLGTSNEVIYEEGALPVVSLQVLAPVYEFPFMRDETGNDIIAATTLSPYSDGDVEASTQYNHSTLVIRPETVASASSLTASGSGSSAKWTATMNPINAYVTERLALRNSTQLDLQIRGDGRTLFQGQLTVLNKIA